MYNGREIVRQFRWKRSCQSIIVPLISMFVELSLCYDYVQIVYREKYLIGVL